MSDLNVVSAHHAPSLERDELTIATYQALTERSIRARKRLKQLLAWLFVLLVLFVLFVLISLWVADDFGVAMVGAVMGAVMGTVVVGIVYMSFALLQMRRLRRHAISAARDVCERMVAELPALGVQPALQFVWGSGGDYFPGVLALDAQRGLLYINTKETGYQRLLLRSQDILSVKVERTATVHTHTTHSGSTSVFFGSAGAGGASHSGSSSRSTSIAVEGAFLEMHYQLPGAAVPSLQVVPFGGDRRGADTFALAIQRL